MHHFVLLPALFRFLQTTNTPGSRTWVDPGEQATENTQVYQSLGSGVHCVELSGKSQDPKGSLKPLGLEMGRQHPPSNWLSVMGIEIDYVVLLGFVNISASLSVQSLFGTFKAQVMLGDQKLSFKMVAQCYSRIMWIIMGSEDCSLKFMSLIWGHLSGYSRKENQFSSSIKLGVGLDE